MQDPELGYNLVLMDLNMPFMDGNQAVREIRNFYESKNAQQPYIVAVTGHGEENFRQRAFESGVNDFIIKPATKD